MNADGSLDLSFSPAANASVYSVAIEANSRLLVGGLFTSLGGQPRHGVGRVSTSEPAVEQVEFEGSAITWIRDGSGPEVSRTWFEVRTNGSATWTPLGTGTRTSNGWQSVGATLPGGTAVRAQGLVSAGRYNGSGYFIESTATIPLIPLVPPRIITDDSSFGLLSNVFGFKIDAAPGQFVVIQTSTNLIDWSPILTNQADSSGLIMFSEPSSPPLPWLFYRLWVSP